MAVITLDSDIATALEPKLRQIETQQDRNYIDADRAYIVAELALVREVVELARAYFTVSLREKVTLAIASKYMTTSTATTPAGILADAQADANRLKAAVDEVLKTMTGSGITDPTRV